MGQLNQNANSRREKQVQTSHKKIQRRRYITFNEFERIKSVLLKNKVYITKSKLSIKREENHEYFLCDENGKLPFLDIHHSSLSICTSKNKKNMWHFSDSIENEIQESKKAQENTVKSPETRGDSRLFMNYLFSDESLSNAEVNDYPQEKNDLKITPFIRPLLSDDQIHDIQEAQKECKEKDELGGKGLKFKERSLTRKKTVEFFEDGALLSPTTAKDKKLPSVTPRTKQRESLSPSKNKERTKGKSLDRDVRRKTEERAKKEKHKSLKSPKGGHDKGKTKPRQKSKDISDKKREKEEENEERKREQKKAKADEEKKALELDKTKKHAEQKDKSEDILLDDSEKKTDKELKKDKSKTSEPKMKHKSQIPHDKSEESKSDKLMKDKQKDSPSREDTKLKQSKSDTSKVPSSDKTAPAKTAPEAKLTSATSETIATGKTGVKSKKSISKVGTAVSRKDSKSKRHLTLEGSQKGKKALHDLYTIYYQLSDEYFIKVGWTLEPRDIKFSRIVTFQTHAAHPLTYAFRDRETVEEKYYPDGKLAVRFEQDSTGKVYYNSGYPAMIFTRSTLGRRVTLYSEPTNDIVKGFTKAKLLGIFDSYGNGVVYNDSGVIRLNYDQAEGISYESRTTKPFKWQWNDYKVICEQRMLTMIKSICNEETALLSKIKPTATRASYKSSYTEDIEGLPYPQPPLVKLKTKKNQNTFSPIMLKITKEMSLKIQGQNNILLNFDSMKIYLRLDLGVVIDPNVELRIDELEVGNKFENIPCFFEVLQEKTSSLMKIANELHTLRHKKQEQFKRMKKLK